MATIELNNDGSGTLSFDGNHFYCKGKPGFDYTRDVTLHPQDCYERKFSKQYKKYMEWAVGPIQWRLGAFVHGHDNPYGPSAGCILMDKEHAERFHDFVKGRNSTQLKVEFPW